MTPPAGAEEFVHPFSVSETECEYDYESAMRHSTDDPMLGSGDTKGAARNHQCPIWSGSEGVATMIRRIAVTILGAAAAASLVTGVVEAGPAAGTGVALASMSTSLDNPTPHPPPGHGPGWDGRHGNWDGRSGFGRGGGWDGNGGGWDGHRWWVSDQRCRAGHGHPARRNDRLHENYCQGGIFNGAPIR